MATSTNSSAFLRLKPLENTNTGSIVQEHIRYWNETKSKEEAEKLAREAKLNEFKRKQSADVGTLLTALNPEDVAPLFNSSFFEFMKENEDFHLELSKNAQDGTAQDKMKYNTELRKVNTMANLTKTVEVKLNDLTKQLVTNKGYNITDEPLYELVNSMSKGFFVVDKKTADIRIISEDGKKVLFDGTADRLQAKFLTSNFSPIVDFNTEAENIGDGLLDTLDSGKQKTPETRIKGIRLVESRFGNSQLLRENYFEFAKRKNYNVPKGKSYNELSDIEKIKVSASFYDNIVDKTIQETKKDTRVEDAIKNETLAEKIRNRKKAEEEEKESKSNIFITRGEEGDAIRRQETSGGLPRVSDYLVDDTLFTIKGEATTQDVKGNTTTTTTYTNLGMGKKGVVAIGTRTVSEQIGFVGDTDTPKYRTITVPYVETDKVKLNTIATKIKDEKGKEFNGLAPLTESLKSLNNEYKAEVTTTNKTKFN